MLKNHILSHSNKRPFTCTHCNFRYTIFLSKRLAPIYGWHCSVCSFKTKGNLTKHMKSKSHTKNYYLRRAAYSNGSSSSSTHQSESESEMESSGECLGKVHKIRLVFSAKSSKCVTMAHFKYNRQYA